MKCNPKEGKDPTGIRLTEPGQASILTMN